MTNNVFKTCPRYSRMWRCCTMKGRRVHFFPIQLGESAFAVTPTSMTSSPTTVLCSAAVCSYTCRRINLLFFMAA
eukprot:scaffold21255_cov33-Tisochrysis_lutea.AAC.2